MDKLFNLLVSTSYLSLIISVLLIVIVFLTWKNTKESREYFEEILRKKSELEKELVGLDGELKNTIGSIEKHALTLKSNSEVGDNEKVKSEIEELYKMTLDLNRIVDRKRRIKDHIGKET